MVLDAVWTGVSTAFAALGRVVLCLDAQFKVLHASPLLDELFGEGAVAFAERQSAADLLGPDLFGPRGTIRSALERGERREGWRASLAIGGGPPRLLSITAAPVSDVPDGVCDTGIRYIVVLRPASYEWIGSDAPIRFDTMVARSPVMLRIFRLIDNLRDSEPTVLLTGESGTGKEMLARAIHNRSPRWNGPFVAVNCGALPGDLLESEMFGHVRGSFTGAVRDREGRCELAHGGTLFLDEIGDIPLHLQVKLLKVLQSRTYERVGESTSRRTDARIIAATNANLPLAIAAGRFREDLFYRLSVVSIDVPPLSERREDIEPLAIHLLARIGTSRQRVLRFSPDALDRLLNDEWQGNVRELENAIEFAVAMCHGETILREHLPEPRCPQPSASTAPPAPASDLRRESADLKAALDAHHWRRADTARALGVSRATLWRRMREAGLE